MKKYKIVLKILSEVRGTRPPATVSLTQRHVEAMKGRILEVLRTKKYQDDEEKLMKEVEKWWKGLLSVFPRKQYNGVEQIAFPNTWILGLLENRASALKLSKINRTVIKNSVMVRPRLIGFRRGGKPITDVDGIIETTIIARDGHPAFKHFEIVTPPAYTEVIYINIYTELIKTEDLKKLLEFGKLGASRGQACGEFKLLRFEEYE